MRRLVRWLLQTAAFMRKELVDMLRQPRTLLVMVFGPFLVMALFGVGYSDTPPALRTVLVVPAGSPFGDQIEQFRETFESDVQIVDVVDDAARADELLREGEVDLAVAFPADPLADVLAGEQAQLLITHTRLDPVERSMITFVSQIAVDELNATVLARAVGAGQQQASSVSELVQPARVAAEQLSALGVDAPDRAELAATIDRALSGLQTLTTSLESITAESGDGDAPALSAAIGGARARIQSAATTAGATADDFAEAADAALTVLDDPRLTQLLEVDPAVIVRPLQRDVQLAVDNVGDVTDWYAPAAVMLMLQQFGVAFGSLAFVRERQLGINEVFRISPVGASSSVTGKYLAYLLVGMGVGAALVALVVGVLDVPLGESTLGSSAIALGLTLFASIGLGLAISLLSRTDTQAVQYTTLVLLASLFFSGFFLSLDQLRGVGRWASLALPVSYGMDLLRGTMLRGAELDPARTAGLAGFGVAVFALVLWGARTRMRAVR